MPGGSNSAGKSLFGGSENVEELIKAAETVTPVPAKNGNLQYIVNAGRNIGEDVTTGQPTDTYTVVTKPNGDVVTMYPGLPRYMSKP